MSRLRRVRLPNGRSKGIPLRRFDQAALRRGAAVEREHTRDPRVAARIAADHLVEDRRYYEKLATIHREGLGAYPGIDDDCAVTPKPFRQGVGFAFGGIAGYALGDVVTGLLPEPSSDVLGVRSGARSIAVTLTFAGLGAMIGALTLGEKPEC